jgi:hypothetical protein
MQNADQADIRAQVAGIGRYFKNGLRAGRE